MKMNRILIVTILLSICGCRTNGSDSDPFFDGKSPESRFLTGAWAGYAAGLTAAGDNTADYRKTVAKQFLLMQLGHCSNVRAYVVFKQESGDTDEHKATFRHVEEAALLIEQEFVKQFAKPTRLELYREVMKRESPNKASDATSEPAPSAASSVHQR